MNAAEWSENIIEDVLSGFRHTYMLWGPVGIWKTTATKTAIGSVECPDCKKHPTYCVVEHLAQMDPVDVRGLMMYNIAKDSVQWHPNPKWMIGSKCRVVYVLDEFNQCERQTQKSALEFTNNHAMGGTPLPEKSIMILMGNRPEDGADVEELIRPQRSRVIHVVAEHNDDVWLDWAVKNGLHPSVISFHQSRKGYIYKPDLNALYGEPLPRSWEKASDVLKCKKEKFWDELIKGTVGGGAGAELMAWIAVGQKLQPLVDQVVAGKDVATDELSSQFFVTASLVDRFRDSKNRSKIAERICTYSMFLKAHNPEAGVTMLRDSARVDRDTMRKSPSWLKAAEALMNYTT